MEDPRDWLASDTGSALPFTVRPFAAVLSMVVKEGERRCLLRYDVEECDLGRAGRCTETGDRGLEVSM